MLTPADYTALKHVHDEKLDREYKLWAIERVEFRNANQMFGEEGIPWQLEDLLGTGERLKRGAKAKAEKADRDLQFLKLQRGLANITKDGAPDELLPEWGKRQWDPKDYPELFGGQRN